MPAVYRQYVDWDDDGDFGRPGEDVTSRTLDGRSPLTIRYGRDQARALSPVSAGTLTFELDNRSRDYSPENAASPLAGQVLPGRRVLTQAILDGTTYTLYRGRLDDYRVKPELGERSVDVTCLDGLGGLRGVRVSTGLHASVRTGEAIGAILDAVGWPADMRDLDPGATVIPWWWADDADALDAVLELVDSEGPSALVTVDSSGRIAFRDRHHRLLSSASQTVQSTWRSSGAVEPLISAPAVYSHGWREIINALAFDVTVRRPATAASVVWSTEQRWVIPASDTITVVAKAASPFFAAVTPVDGVDYTTATGTVSMVLSRTSGQSTTITITASAGGTAVVDSLRLRAVPLESATVVVSGEDTTSIAAYGRRSLPDVRTPVWAGVYDARAIIDLILGRRAERVPTITVSMVGAGSPQRLVQQLTRDIGDRVHVVEGHTGLDADCWIEQITHTIGQGGLEHRTMFGLERVPAVQSAMLRFDVSGQGFDDGVFAGVGYDDPALMLRFDVSGQGFDDGVFAN